MAFCVWASCMAATACGVGSSTPKSCPGSRGVLNSTSRGLQVWSNTDGAYWVWGNKYQPTTTYYTDSIRWDAYEHAGAQWYAHLGTYPSSSYPVDTVREPLGVTGSTLRGLMSSGTCEAAPSRVTEAQQNRNSATLVDSATEYGTDTALLARRVNVPVDVIADGTAGVSLTDITNAIQGAPGPQFSYLDASYLASNCADAVRCPFLDVAEYSTNNHDAGEFFADGATQRVAGCDVNGWTVMTGHDPEGGFIATKGGNSISVTGNLADDSTPSGTIQPVSQCAAIVSALGSAASS